MVHHGQQNSADRHCFFMALRIQNDFISGKSVNFPEKSIEKV